MSGVAKITISLTAEHAGIVEKAVESGRYAHASEVIRDALRLWEDQEYLRERRRDELRRLIQEGLDSGPGKPFDMGAIKTEAMRRVAARKKAA